MILIIIIATILAGAKIALQIIKKDDRSKGLRISDEEYTIGGTIKKAFTRNKECKRYCDSPIDKKNTNMMNKSFIFMLSSWPVVAIIDIISGKSVMQSLFIMIFTTLLLIYAARRKKIRYAVMANIALIIIFTELIKIPSFSLIPYLLGVSLYDVIMGIDVFRFYNNQ